MKILYPFWNKEQKRLRFLPRLILLFIFYELFSTAITFLVYHCGFFPFDSPAATGLVILATSALPVFLAGRLLDRRRFSEFGFHIDRAWLKSLWFGVLLGAVLMVAIFIIELAFGWITILDFFGVNTMRSSIPTIGYFWSQFFQSLLFYFCAALSEELFFRAYPIRNLRESLGSLKINPKQLRWLAAILTSLVFGLAHLGNPYSSWISTFNIFVAGMMLALPFILSGELAFSIGLHFSWNFFQGVVFGFPISGTIASANLVRLQQNGPEILTGGYFGPEAGLLGLAAMLIGSGTIYFFYLKQNRV